MDDVRQALDRIAAAVDANNGNPLILGGAYDKLDAALREALDECDTSLAMAADDRGETAMAMRIVAKAIRASILSALTDSPDMAMEDR